jgi:flagellar basal-body rod protein FlgC
MKVADVHISKYKILKRGLRHMTFSVYSNLAALNAFGTKMAVTANNVANVNTDGFKKSRAIIEEDAPGGIKVDITQIDSPGSIYYETIDGEEIERETSNVELTEEIPQTTLTRRYFEANLKIIQTQDEMLGTLLDTIG